LTRHYAESHLREIYQGKLYYGRDAFEGLAICDRLAAGDLASIDEEIQIRLTKRADTEARVAEGKSKEKATTAVAIRAETAPVEDIPVPPFWGSRLAEPVDLEEIYPFVNTVALFRGQWGFKKGSMSKEEYDETIREVAEPVFERLKVQCRKENILRPQVVYGYFPCLREGDDLVVFDGEDQEREVERFSFPRQTKGSGRCLSDYFRAGSSEGGNGVKDVVAFHCVTMGIEVSHRARQLFERDEYTEYLYLHGLGVEGAEALAEYWHKRIRIEMGIDSDDATEIRKLFTNNYRGCRYSFGYPACPEMADQEKLFRLLQPERIGCVLTENWQIDPEQSTSAIVVHHPEAKYFNA